MSLGNGLGILKDRVFRIGHLGDINDLTLLGAISGVEMGGFVANFAAWRTSRMIEGERSGGHQYGSG
jgi:hypothetical protein